MPPRFRGGVNIFEFLDYNFIGLFHQGHFLGDAYIVSGQSVYIDT